MAKIKNYDGQTGMELSYVAVQATRPKKKTVDWVGITETFIAGGMWVIVFMMLGLHLRSRCCDGCVERPVRYLHREEPVHGEKPLTGMQRIHKKGPRQRQLRKVQKKNNFTPSLYGGRRRIARWQRQ